MLILIKEKRERQMNRIKESLYNLINYCKFLYLLLKNQGIGNKSPDIILKVIKIFISLESNRYPNSLYFNRGIAESSTLLCSLIDSYLNTKSEVTLNQLLEVLKEEFIKREGNVRK